MKLKMNRSFLEDKIYACWIGKNIGGTLGGPFERTRKILDITDFITPKGEPLPNDDLDLQMVWLYALEEEGPWKLSQNVLSEYWITCVVPHWNEYGIAKANMKFGLLAPMCGEYKNDSWKNSNGAWIRSEIWACLAPGIPELATKYALVDACVDHGMSDGTFAEIFTATMESLAFIRTDIRGIIEEAMARIPSDCRVYKSIELVINEYDKGTDWKTVRNMLVELDKDIGWFQAPAHIGYVVAGLLYGEGDFKKSMLTAVNCGDDTDCTAATVGAFLGILYGMKGIPEDWKEFVGDRIVTNSIDVTNCNVPKNCTELTERTLNMLIPMLKANHIDAEFADVESFENFDEKLLNAKAKGTRGEPALYKWSYLAGDYVHSRVVVEYETEPVIVKNVPFKIKVHIQNRFCDFRNILFDVSLPEGWHAEEYKRSDFINLTDEGVVWELVVTATDNIQPVNRFAVIAVANERPIPMTVPIVILG